MPVADSAVLERGHAVIMRDELGEAAPQLGDEHAQALGTRRRQVDGDAAGNDPVHHQPMAEAGVAGLQDLLAQDAAMGVHEREGGVVADEAEIVDVVGDAARARPSARAARRARGGGSPPVAASTARAKARA